MFWSYTRQNKQIPFRLTSASNYNKYSSLSLYRWIKSQSADWKATPVNDCWWFTAQRTSCSDVLCPLYRERSHVGEILKIRARWRNIHVSVLLLTIKISQWARENFDSYCKKLNRSVVVRRTSFVGCGCFLINSTRKLKKGFTDYLPLKCKTVFRYGSTCNSSCYWIFLQPVLKMAPWSSSVISAAKCLCVEAQSPENIKNCLFYLLESHRGILSGLVYLELFLQHLPASARTELHSNSTAMRALPCTYARNEGKNGSTLVYTDPYFFGVLSDCSSLFVWKRDYINCLF